MDSPKRGHRHSSSEIMTMSATTASNFWRVASHFGYTDCCSEGPEPVQPASVGLVHVFDGLPGENGEP